MPSEWPGPFSWRTITDLFFLACASQIVLALWGRVIYPISLHPHGFLWCVCLISDTTFDSQQSKGGWRIWRKQSHCVDWETLIALAFSIWPLTGLDWGKCQPTILCLRPAWAATNPGRYSRLRPSDHLAFVVPWSFASYTSRLVNIVALFQHL